MKAIICQNCELQLVDLPAPAAGPGQVVIDVLGCGICGSDLHVRRHADAEADVLAEIGYDGFMRSGQQVVLGHEFVGEVGLRAGDPEEDPAGDRRGSGAAHPARQ